MSGGRLMVGLGSQVKGHITRRFGMPFTKPAQRMKDYVGAMRACWRAWQNREPLNFQSEHYNLSLMTPTLRRRRLTWAYSSNDCRGAGADAASGGRGLRGVRLHGIVTRQYIDQVAMPNLKKGFAKPGKLASGVG